MKQGPTVSVVIPCFNASPFLRETLDSAVNQTHPPLEIILVDDGSTDDSAAIAESYGGPVRVIRQENQGESVARNRGIDEAQGDWIAFLDADDVWEPRRIEAQLQSLSPDAILAHCNIRFFGSDCAESVSRIENEPFGERYLLKNLCQNNCFLTASTIFVKRVASPRFPIDIRYAEDLIYILEAVQRGPVAFSPEVLVRYRRHHNSQSASVEARIGWFNTVTDWVRQNTENLPPEAIGEIRRSWLGQLTSTAWRLKEDRNWEGYWKIRTLLSSYSDEPVVANLLSNTIYPEWMYRFADLLVWNSSPYKR